MNEGISLAQDAATILHFARPCPWKYPQSKPQLLYSEALVNLEYIHWTPTP